MNQVQELRVATAMIRRSDALWVFGAATVVMTLVIGGLVLLTALYADDPGAFLSGFWQEMREDPVLVGMAVLVVALTPVLLYATARSRLRITPEGLYGHVSPWLGVGLLGWSTGEIRIPWSAIRAADLIPGRQAGFGTQRLAGYRLILQTADRTFRLAPYLWRATEEPDHRIGFFDAFRKRDFDADGVIERTPLVREARARALFGQAPGNESDPADSNAAFDIMKHRGLLAQVVLFLAALVYALADGLAINPYRLLEGQPWLFLVAVALIAAAVVNVSGRGAPRMERLAVGIMTVAAVTAASYPLFLRINAWTGTSQEVIYTATEEGSFRSIEGDHPPVHVDVARAPEYWAQFGRGERHTFTLVRGVADVYQLDTRPIFRETRAFYRRQSNE